jgi:hypothetical protein
MTWAAPWALLGFAVLPMLWWLMRLQPPAPRTQIFPALKLLGLHTHQTAQQRLPWWLMLLRLLLAACVILGLAGPRWRDTSVQHAAVRQTLVIDSGWTAASRFEDIRRRALQALDAHSSASTQVRLMPTAAAQNISPEWISPSLARQRIETLEPMPWAADRAALTKWPASGDMIWISDGLDHASARALIDWGQKSGAVTVYEATRLPPAQIRRVVQNPAGLAVTVAQPPALQPRSYTVTARNADGSSAAFASTTMAAGQTTAQLLVPLAPGTAVRLSQIEINGEASSAGVHLLDAGAARVFVGISHRGTDTPQPLRAADFYVERALQTHATVARGSSDALLARGVNILVIAGQLPQQPAAQAKLNTWVAKGGVLVMFAGPHSLPAQNSLLPITIRAATRNLGGAMSWSKAASLGPWPKTSPFAGLAIPADVSVQQQWLAEPGLASTAQSWAQLADATPLVSAQQRGRGLVVLFHTSANADWSNLALSGLFEQMLVKLLPFASSLHPQTQTAPNAPYQLTEALNGTGRLQPATPGKSVRYDRLRAADAASAMLPPGRYTKSGQQFALNVGGAPPGWISNYKGAQLQSGTVPRLVFDARPLLLIGATLLLLLDGLATLYLKGLWRRPRRQIFAALLCLPGLASPHDTARAAPDGAFDVRLCAVQGVADTEAMAGLQNLAQALKMRTAIVPGNPKLVQLADRNLGLCSLLYWPISDSSPALDATTGPALQRYMAQGGFLIIDSGWSNGVPRRVLDPLQLPPLDVFTPGHVLAKSFYLLERTPGGFDFSSVWLERGTQGSDGRTSQVMLVQSRIASQWRNGGREQERALRLGINSVIYALTGTYKADQVHAAGLLERMARQPK